MPQVSVLLPFFNAAPTLNIAVESIVHQTFGDWELLLIDNGSTDDGPLLAEKWTELDGRIRLTSCSERGIAHALNHGLNFIESPYIARMDADDWSHSSRLEKQIDYLDQHPEIGVVSCQTTFQSTSPKSEGYEHFLHWQNSIITPEEHTIHRFKESPVAHPTVMFRRALIDQLGSYSTEPIPEDYELWMRWMEAGVQFAKIPEELLTWYDDVSRLSRTHPNYSEEAFFKVKGQYLARWMERHVGPDGYREAKKVVASGTSKECRQRAHWLMEQGVQIDYLTDIVQKSPKGFEFLPYQEIGSPEEYFVLNLIGKRGVNEEVENYFNRTGFLLGESFLSLS